MFEELKKQLASAVDAIINSGAKKKVVVAGPGTGKTWLFRQLLSNKTGEDADSLVLTFINNLKGDLERDLGQLAQVYTFHGYCRRLLHQRPRLRTPLTKDFHYFPPLASLIKIDWEIIHGGKAPHFIGLMRDLDEKDEIGFYIARANYYNAVAFDDSVFRVYKGFEGLPEEVEQFSLLLVDEYQDFNKLEVGFIRHLAAASPTVIAGDDDQALYSQLRSSNAKYIRELYGGTDYDSFTLPFCMRCTEPIVGAVEDVVSYARKIGKLKGRINKPYCFYPPEKGTDSKQFPRIKVIETTVQMLQANYFGKYIEQEIKLIPPEHIQESQEGQFPTVLVIGPAQYLRQIREHLEAAGYFCQISGGEDPTQLKREAGLRMLQMNPGDNMGWRILLEVDQPFFRADIIRQSVIEQPALAELIPREYKEKILSEASQLPPEENAPGEKPQGEGASELTIKLTSYEGSKGLSAQNVFIVGFQEGDLPRNATKISDLEICKFLVALTRTRKQCHILYTKRWSGQPKRPSIFLKWINPKRLQLIKVDRFYWK